MLKRGDRQHDIAAWFGVNGGRIAEIANLHTFKNVLAAPENALPPVGPYPSGRASLAAIEALAQAKHAIHLAEITLQKTFVKN